MGRSPQTSIRFDSEKLELIKTREGLETVQKVVDYLVDAYWWEYKLRPRTKSGEPMTEFETLERQVQDADDIAPLEFVKWAAIKSKSLNAVDKQLLLSLAGDKIKKLKTP